MKDKEKMDIDFIIDCTRKTDFIYRYSIINGIGHHQVGMNGFFYSVETHVFKMFIYPLLLQRAIEGVNRLQLSGELKLRITIDSTAIRVKCGGFIQNQFYIKNFIDNAKESALRYIYDQSLLQETK